MTDDSNGATRTAPAGSSTSRLTWTCPCATRAFDPSPSCLLNLAIADAEPEVGAVRRRDVHLSGSKQRDRLVLMLTQRRVIDVERLDIDGVPGRGVRAGQPVRVTRAVVPMEMDWTAAASVQPLRQGLALIGRRDGIPPRRKRQIDIGPRQPLGEIRRGSIRARLATVAPAASNWRERLPARAVPASSRRSATGRAHPSARPAP